ncbi:hypothetical protein F8388_024548 [Cannabis sativa]|uniref:DUF4283 domain-containing protein n=1 Tax=Cannabis sativa TaxID=3483 RepID=A0A7J6HUR3_CANSA|nr:hypothetical protein F8388_024548 [Cannabis sativa]KAF4398952.1 hypothetical protein G4B88_023546 [Cannabis sativa]
MGEKGKEICMDVRDEETDKLLERDSNMEMEMLELFEDITLEDVVASKACVGRVIGCKDMLASVVKKILQGVWRWLGYWRMKKCPDGVLGFFFEEEEDYQFVMDKRPWIINGVLLNLKPWPIEGEVSLGEFEVAMFWVQFHGLPTRFLSLDNVPLLAKKLAHWEKLCSSQTAMVIPRCGPAVQMYGTWLKSETGRSNCFNMAGNGTIKSVVEFEEVPEWDFAPRNRKNYWRRKKNLDDQKLPPAAVTALNIGEGQSNKRKVVQGQTSTTSVRPDVAGTELEERAMGNEKLYDESPPVENVEFRLMENIQQTDGPNIFELPTPDFSLNPNGLDLIPDIGPTIAQSLEIPHSWLCRSQTPHDFPEPTYLKWPNDDLEAQSKFFQLYGPDFTNLYKAQASLISNPPDLSMMIVQLLGSKKRKPHTWYQPTPAITSFDLPSCPDVSKTTTEVEGNGEAKFNIGSSDKAEEKRKRRLRRSGITNSKRNSGVKTRRERRKEALLARDIASVGIGGGFCLAWRNDVTIDIVETFDSGFHGVIPSSRGSCRWHLFCIYWTPYPEKKAAFWKWLTDKVSVCGEPWMVLGDLNAILDNSEKVGGNRCSRREGAFLRDFLMNTGGIDLGFQGVQCTWHNARKGNKNIRKRLDRGLANSCWITSFPSAKISNLPILGSDHSPILLSLWNDSVKLNFPFRFLEVWTSSPECEMVIDKAWQQQASGNGEDLLRKKLKRTKSDLKYWNQHSFAMASTEVIEHQEDVINEPLIDQEFVQYCVDASVLNSKAGLGMVELSGEKEIRPGVTT